MKATMTTKGQVTIPAAIRRQLKLAPGDKLDFFINDQQHLIGLPRAGDERTAPKPFARAMLRLNEVDDERLDELADSMLSVAQNGYNRMTESIAAIGIIEKSTNQMMKMILRQRPRNRAL